MLPDNYDPSKLNDLEKKMLHAWRLGRVDARAHYSEDSNLYSFGTPNEIEAYQAGYRREKYRMMQESSK